MNLISISQIKLIAISALFFLVTTLLIKPVEQKRSDYLPPPNAIKNLSIGLNNQFADLLWLRALQDFDYCETKINQTECKSKSWLFQTLNLMTEIDPVLDPIMYRMSGLALTVIISDYAGASVMFDKAVAQYPNDWSITYAAAYHALFEEKNNLKAAGLYEAAAKNGAPAWVYSMAGRLANEGGDREYAEKIIQGMIETNQDEKIIRRLREKISTIESVKK